MLNFMSGHLVPGILFTMRAVELKAYESEHSSL